MGSSGRVSRSKKLKWVPIIIVLAFLAGCASPAKKACLETDWSKLGYDEGVRGERVDSSLSHRQSCQREGVPPDILRYEQGRRQGLEKYCTSSNGRALGARGGLYLGVCPPDLKESFKAAYHDGLQTHTQKLSAEISTLTVKQNSLRRELAAVEEQMSYLEKEVAQAGTGQARVMMGLISEMQMLEGDQMSLSLQIDALGMDLKEMRQRLYQIKKQADEVSK